ncbi:MAG: adenine phosphoribosyltransferase [Acidobacteriota bacterium]
MDDLKHLIREVPDFPKPGILFYDITTLLAHPGGLRATTDHFTALLRDQVVDKVVGIESRGFLFAPQLAYALHAGFVPARKPGKLPAAVEREAYGLEYGDDTLEIHRDAVVAGERVLIVDDVVATGGTAAATARLVERLGGEVVALAFVVELTFLDARAAALESRVVHSLIRY